MRPQLRNTNRWHIVVRMHRVKGTEMLRLALMLSALASALAWAPGLAVAADLSMPRAEAAEASAEPPCGPCGCLTVTYVRHRELRSTYGAGFDPRNFDTAEPQFYFGPMKEYPRYYVDGAPIPHQCNP
jgi:hypothetical protein